MPWIASGAPTICPTRLRGFRERSEEHTSELQSQSNLVCRLLLEKKKSDSIASPGHRFHAGATFLSSGDLHGKAIVPLAPPVRFRLTPLVASAFRHFSSRTACLPL